MIIKAFLFSMAARFPGNTLDNIISDKYAYIRVTQYCCYNSEHGYNVDNLFATQGSYEQLQIAPRVESIYHLPILHTSVFNLEDS